MLQRRDIILGAIGFFLLAWIAFKAISALIEPEDVQFETPAPDAGLADLKLQILDDEGNPPESCVVILWNRSDGKLRTGPGQSGKCSGGEIAWKGLQPGTYLLEVAVPNCERMARNVELSPGDREDLGVVKMGPGGILTARAVAPDGRGLPGAQIWLGNWLVTADSEGRYRFVGAPAGKLRVRAQFDQITDMAEVELKKGEDIEAEIRLDELIVRGVLGVEITPEPEGIRVTHVSPKGPAAGILQEGDRILAANKLPTLGLSEMAANARLDGPPKEALKLQILRDTETLEVEVVRGDLIDILAEEMKREGAASALTAPPAGEGAGEK